LLQQEQINGTPDAWMLSRLIQALSHRMRANGSAPATFDDTTQLLEVGLLDSQGLLDLILEVEEGCGRVFNPERVDFADTLTLGNLANAFT
jgi:acyl carrier protein